MNIVSIATYIEKEGIDRDVLLVVDIVVHGVEVSWSSLIYVVDEG
jgi:hypothetical protein